MTVATNKLVDEASTGSPDFPNGMPTVEGVPIVQSGSNSDGQWTRYADGTQLCYSTKDTAHATSFERSGIYMSPAILDDYPMPFVGGVCGGVGYFDNETTGFWMGGKAYDNNGGWATAAYRINSFSAGEVGTYELWAHGRWK